MQAPAGSGRRTPWWAAAVLAVVAAAAVVGAIRRQAPGRPAGRLQVVGFYEDTGPSSLPSLRSHWRALTTVTPRWFTVGGAGTVSNIGYQAAVAAFVRRHHRALVPLVNNGPGAAAMLASAALRTRAARRLTQLVIRDGFNGLNIDFELLPATVRSGLAAFMADLRADLGPHKVLAVSVFPLVGVPSSVNGLDDYPALARSANYLVIMTYDHHYSGGPPGPVAPYGWVAANVRAALRQVPANRLMLAIGMYGYDWPATGVAAATVSDVQAEALAKAHGTTPQYDAANSQNHFTYASGTGGHTVWYMGDRSAHARVRLAQADHLAGVALWRLGYEDPRFWSSLGV